MLSRLSLTFLFAWMDYIYIFFNTAFAVFRCIKPQLKSFALGIYTLAIRVLGKSNLCFSYGSYCKCILNTFPNIFTELSHITKWCIVRSLFFFIFFLSTFLLSFPWPLPSFGPEISESQWMLCHGIYKSDLVC